MGELEGLLMIIGIIGFGIWAVFGTDETSKYRSTRRYTDEGEKGSSTYGKLVAQRKLEAVAKEKLQKEKAEDAEKGSPLSTGEVWRGDSDGEQREG